MEIVDYAMPLMNIERLAKQIHDKCLDKKLDEAEELAIKLGAEARILIVTLAIMQDKITTRTGENQDGYTQTYDRQVV